MSIYDRERYALRRDTVLERTLTSDRSRYLDGKINARIGLCPEPTHPLDVAAPAPAADKRNGASHRFEQIERNAAAQRERFDEIARQNAKRK